MVNSRKHKSQASEKEICLRVQSKASPKPPDQQRRHNFLLEAPNSGLEKSHAENPLNARYTSRISMLYRTASITIGIISLHPGSEERVSDQVKRWTGFKSSTVSPLFRMFRPEFPVPFSRIQRIFISEGPPSPTFFHEPLC